MSKQIYADNAATTKLDDCVLEAMLPWLVEDYGNASQPYSFSRKPKAAIEESKRIIAAAINAMPEEIFFTSGGTESDNWAIKGCLLQGEKRYVITSAIEHHAVLNSCKSMERIGCSAEYLTPDNQGIINPNVLEQSINDDTKLVSIMLSNNEIGTIEPIQELAEITHKHNALFHTDAVQAVGHIPIDVRDLGVDLLSASAHKFNGPKGVGFLYIRKGTSIMPYNDGGAQEQGLRAGTENVAGIVGMATALSENCSLIDSNIKHIQTLENRLIYNLRNLDYIKNGANNHLPGIVSLSFNNADGEAILHRMDLKGICISTGSACDSVNSQVSHVIKAINVPSDYAGGTIRISLGKNNTIEEIDKISSALISILSGS